jgi:hypothetical protein
MVSDGRATQSPTHPSGLDLDGRMYLPTLIVSFPGHLSTEPSKRRSYVHRSSSSSLLCRRNTRVSIPRPSERIRYRSSPRSDTVELNRLSCENTSAAVASSGATGDTSVSADAAARSSSTCCHASVSCELFPSVVNESDGRKGFAGSSRSIAGVEGGRREQGRSWGGEEGAWALYRRGTPSSL